MEGVYSWSYTDLFRVFNWSLMVGFSSRVVRIRIPRGSKNLWTYDRGGWWREGSDGRDKSSLERDSSKHTQVFCDWGWRDNGMVKVAFNDVQA